jgi:arabinan endo-1,5-alpha-L-arabinosidase
MMAIGSQSFRRGAGVLTVAAAIAFLEIHLAMASTIPQTYHNPVIEKDWPDPGVIAVEDSDGQTSFYLVSTGGSLPIRRSTDLIHWEETGARAMPEGKAPWAPDGFRNWAPELHRIGDRYVLYYTSSDHRRDAARPDPLAIGAAWSDDILGPYHHLPEPIVPAGPHGTIDATYFRDGDRHWLYWKTDGNCCGERTDILARELAPDGLSFVDGSEPQLVLTADLEWEHNLIEGPWLLRRGEWVYLFYSAGSFVTNYRNGVARSRSPLGPFEKLPEPWLRGSDDVRAPGHGSFLQLDDTTVFVHHGRSPGIPHARYLFVTPLEWRDEWPHVEGGVTPLTATRTW